MLSARCSLARILSPFVDLALGLGLVLLTPDAASCLLLISTALSGALNCSKFANCNVCTNVDGCVWCLSQGSCTSLKDCPLTPYTDCCVLHSNCDDCNNDINCAYCRVDNIKTCMARSPYGMNTSNPQSPCPEPWNALTCPSQSIYIQSPFWQYFAFGLSGMLASAFVIIALILLVMWLWTNQNKLAAEREIRKIYQEKKDVSRSLHEFESKLATNDAYTTLAPLINRLRTNANEDEGW